MTIDKYKTSRIFHDRKFGLAQSSAFYFVLVGIIQGALLINYKDQ